MPQTFITSNQYKEYVPYHFQMYSVCVCVHVSMHTCECVSVYMHVCVPVCMHACVCVSVCVHVCTCVYACVCTCVCACMCLSVYVCVCTCLCVYLYVCVCLSVYVYMCTCVDVPNSDIVLLYLQIAAIPAGVREVCGAPPTNAHVHNCVCHHLVSITARGNVSV